MKSLSTELGRDVHNQFSLAHQLYPSAPHTPTALSVHQRCPRASCTSYHIVCLWKHLVTKWDSFVTKEQSLATDAKSRLTGKDADAGKDWGQEEKGTTEDEMAGWYHQFNGHEFEQALEDGEGQGSLACCSSWVHRVRHDWATEQQQQRVKFDTLLFISCLESLKLAYRISIKVQ